MSDVAAIAALAVLAGGLSLDATAAFQIMVSQPLVAGVLAGALLGEPATGLAVGTTLQLVWVGVMPVGAAQFPDATVGAVVGVGVAWSLLQHGGQSGWPLALGVISGLVVAAVGQRLVRALRRFNVRLSDMASARAEHGDASGVTRAVSLGVAARFVCGAGLAAASLGVLVPLLRALPVLEGTRGFPAVLWAAPVAAASIAARPRAGLERVLLAAGFAVGLAALGGGR